jgi:hypothetical protein
MTREEDKAIRKARNRKEYEARKERKKAWFREYYAENREYINMKHKIWRDRKRQEAFDQGKTPPPKSTDALEAELPYALRTNIPRLRQEYLSIHITERPQYEIFLKYKTAQYYKEYGKTKN